MRAALLPLSLVSILFQLGIVLPDIRHGTKIVTIEQYTNPNALEKWVGPR
jgi:hypothetical protein